MGGVEVTAHLFIFNLVLGVWLEELVVGDVCIIGIGHIMKLERKPQGLKSILGFVSFYLIVV